MAAYFQDSVYKSFYWVKRSPLDRAIIGVPMAVNYCYLVQHFVPDQFEDMPYDAWPQWVLAVRDKYIDIMRRGDIFIIPPLLKPPTNLAIPILCRLSGFEAEKIKKLLGY